MVHRNPHFSRLKANYLFPEINQRKQQFLDKNPGVELINLGIGDTTEPIPNTIAQALASKAAELGTAEGYIGYGPEQGIKILRETIAAKLYGNRIDAEDVFVSDGAKCDIGRLQALFGSAVSIAVQDPAYPVYVDGSILHGVESIAYMPCTPENNFFPALDATPKTGLLYFCSPNNPTGAVATREELTRLVAFAKERRSIIIFDSAYAHFVQDSSLPSSIYEIDGADEVAVETGSFSKIAGFTGVRLGWTIVPKKLRYEDGSSVQTDWRRLTSTIFNGACNIAQYGGIAVLSDAGQKEIEALTHFYMENTRLLKNSLTGAHYTVYGGDHAPYLWIKFEGRTSWEMFQEIMEKHRLVTTPGVGFGPCGEGFIRLSAFGHRHNILKAAERLARL